MLNWTTVGPYRFCVTSEDSATMRAATVTVRLRRSGHNFHAVLTRDQALALNAALSTALGLDADEPLVEGAA